MFADIYILFLSLLLASAISGTISQCPWQRDILELQTSCICAYNLGRELSVQCDQVNFFLLMDTLSIYATQKPIDLLYINNSTINELPSNIFQNLSVHNVQLSSCQIRKIQNGAFNGQETMLKNLNLQDNLLTEVPTKAINSLNKLNLLDLSKNRITFVSNSSFSSLKKLSTLKLNDNNVTLDVAAFSGLDESLKNLNLKGTKQRHIPESIRGLKSLAFLDLSLNGIKELPGAGGIRTFEGLDSLTALNLERNFIQSLGETSFAGIRKTLSSLSLLNNLLSEFPIGAIHALKELRVLDIGFNLLTSLPEGAFRGNPGITLLALDGNPLNTVPQIAFAHLNSTLRGLSLGGRFLHCDCKLRWVAEWIRNGDLQVTSRERNPQFCGSPTNFRDRGFYSIQPEELICSDVQNVSSILQDIKTETSLITQTNTTSKPIAQTSTITSNDDIHHPELFAINTSTTASSLQASTKTATMTSTPQPTIDPPTKTSSTMQPVASSTLSTNPTISSGGNSTLTIKPSLSRIGIKAVATNATNNGASNSLNNSKQSGSWRLNSSTTSSVIAHSKTQKQQRPPLILSFPPQRDTRFDDTNEVQVKNAFRQENSVIIQWDSDTANILGFRVVYRLFGEKTFKQGPPLEASEREFKIKNVPAQECIIVCVISLEELHVTPETVPYQQCREVRTVASQTSNMDKITIAASAAICGTIIVAVIVFIAASRRSRKLQNTQQKNPLPIGGLPVACCGPAGSPGPLGSIATLSAFNNHKEWDQMSAYSGRSIPRPRIYSVDNQEDMRSHFSAMTGKVGKASYSQAGSTHTINNYCDTSDNWTDHDMDIYMARNPTTRNGLVPL
ncbi:leucine-rich repeat and fibronectin type-III domain-containing protein 2 isoform X2 [Bactrocera dorsalis]|uniref:Leucine-rich repeat and fibronectin type-III domain-containing protein 2 isoform X2 n=1 Tax=Bactrocera dorsalis TaxID=27457 RepID=A0A034WFY3_BACDO|nr:leucine-rich repeat and fibronectin type-III domain-containing protein 2 isoform X2 [Bactrocera dorsalis]